MQRGAVGIIAGMIALIAIAGCGGPPVLRPQQFVRARAEIPPNGTMQPVDQNGAVVYGHLHAPLLPDEYAGTGRPSPGISPLVQHAVPSPGKGQGVDTSAGGPTTNVTSAPSVAGGYWIVGKVLIKVEGKPIYADKVLGSIDKELAAEARQFPPDQFREAAQRDIMARTQEMIAAMLEVAAAERELNKDAKSHAEVWAMIWRQQQITAAGGSQELAQQRALENGTTLDEEVRREYEAALVQIYYAEKVVPRIQVTASDIRRYYEEHLESDFTQHAEAHFRVIKIDIERSGGKEQATQKADKIIYQLRHNASFADLARSYNDDPILMEKSGDVGSVRQGSYVVPEVEAAVWQMHPGEFTDHPIEARDASGQLNYYIAKLEDRKPGATKAFDDPAVQQKIRETLSSQQFTALRMQKLAELRRNAFVEEVPNAMETAVEMAMQRYPLWASAK